MNRRSFIAKAVLGLAAIPLIGKASEGKTEPPQHGRFYVAGERGPELIFAPSQRVIVAIDNDSMRRAMETYSSTPRGRRARLIRRAALGSGAE